MVDRRDYEAMKRQFLDWRFDPSTPVKPMSRREYDLDKRRWAKHVADERRKAWAEHNAYVMTKRSQEWARDESSFQRIHGDRGTDPQTNHDQADRDRIENKTYKPPNIRDDDPAGTINEYNWPSWQSMRSKNNQDKTDIGWKPGAPDPNLDYPSPSNKGWHPDLHINPTNTAAPGPRRVKVRLTET